MNKSEMLKREISHHELEKILSEHSMYLVDSNKGKKANLSDCYLRGKRLYAIDLRGANLAGADFKYAYLDNAKLSCADLRGANLRGVSLLNVDFFRANLEGAYFDKSFLDRTDLSACIGII